MLPLGSGVQSLDVCSLCVDRHKHTHYTLKVIIYLRFYLRVLMVLSVDTVMANWIWSYASRELA